MFMLVLCDQALKGSLDILGCILNLIDKFLSFSIAFFNPNQDQFTFRGLCNGESVKKSID